MIGAIISMVIKMKTIMFDFDGTLTKKNNNIWERMWQIIGASDVDYKLYKKYKNKEINYIEWVEEIEKEYIKRNFNKAMLLECCKDIEIINGLEETLIALKKEGYKLYIVSGGVDVAIRNTLGCLTKYFDGISSCKFRFDDNGNLIDIIPTKYDEEGKRIFIEEYCTKKNTKPEDITFVGNGDNDEWVYLSGCKTICLNPVYHHY